MLGRYAHLIRKIAASNFSRLRFPYKLTYALTYRCNSRCLTCNIWKKHPGNELSLEEIERFFKSSPDFAWIDLTGGEPSLRRDFAQIAQIIHSCCRHLVLLHFPTNGYLTDKIVADVEKVLSLRPAYKIIITISTDGDEHLNDHIRGVKGAWRRQVETFVQLQKLGTVEPVFGMTLSPFNYDRFQQTYDSLKQVVPQLQPHHFHISLMNYSESFYDNMELKQQTAHADQKRTVQQGMITSVKAYKAMIGMPATPRLWLEHKYLTWAEGFLQTGRTPLPCHALKSSCFIDPTGEVFPCITFNHALGNLRDHDYRLHRIWELNATRQLQHRIWNLQCPQCWTGCDAYQTIMGNVRRLMKPRA